MTEVFWITLAYLLGLIARQLGLPTLIGYLAAGFVLSANGFGDSDALEHIAHIGVLLLLFAVGLKLRLKSLLRPEVIFGGSLHMLLFVLALGGVMAVSFAMQNHSAFLLAAALSFSSTVVAAKVLESKKELRAFHGRLAIGILIIQDLVAVGLLSAIGNDAPSLWALLLLGLPLLRPLLYRLLDITGHGELQILYGLLLALVIGGAGFQFVGLSGELGALLLGAMLADHRRSSELANSIWGLKEVLLIGFFLQIGMAGAPTVEAVGIAALLCLLIPLKAMLFFFIVLRFGLRARSAFLASLSLATYSEFGLIVVQLGVKDGIFDESWLTITAITVALSFLLAAPFNRISHELYERYAAFLKRFESDRRHPDDEPINLGSSHILIMGMGRLGTGAYDFLTRRSQRVVGLDSDLGKVEAHLRDGRRVLYADAEDPGLWENVHLDGIHAIILALPDFEANVMAVNLLRKRGYKGHITATATFPDRIAAITKAGADSAYNYYSDAGVGLAERVWEALNSPTKRG